MDEKQIQQVVAEVLKRLVPLMGANGERGTLIFVFSGATQGYAEALQQIRSAVLRGFRVDLVFSHGAEQLYAKYAWEQLQGFPHVGFLNTSKWLHRVKDARGIVVPMLSVNTLSKLSLLIADNLASNVILHGLFCGKPVVLAQNGVDPSDVGRTELHFPGASAALVKAIEERLQVVRGYGCRVTDVSQLSDALEAALEPKATARPHGSHVEVKASAPGRKGNIITAADVLLAQQSGRHLQFCSSARMTPLARELASKHGVSLMQDVSH